MSDEKRERGREVPAIWAARSGRLGQPALPTAGFGGRGKAAMEFAGGTPAPLRTGRQRGRRTAVSPAPAGSREGDNRSYNGGERRLKPAATPEDGAK